MKLGLALVFVIGLAGCMKTSEQVAQETAADIEICKNAGAPINECMANIRQYRGIREARRNQISTCSTYGNVTNCY